MAFSSTLRAPFLVAASPPSPAPFFATPRNPNSCFPVSDTRPSFSSSAMAVSSSGDDGLPSLETPKLVTFLGKGGSGKTTAAIIAAQHYALAGLRTCLLIHSQDQTADYILSCKIGTTLVNCSKNLSAVRLETTKMLLEPLRRLKQADGRLYMTQGVLEELKEAELGVLPGMDPLFSLYMLEKLVQVFGTAKQPDQSKEKFDIIIYDGVSTDETLRIIGTASRARLYLKYLRRLAEKTDIGRLVGPSLVRLTAETLNLQSDLNDKISAEVWDTLERALERGASSFAEPHKFGCYVVMDPNNPTSVRAALRFWGCALQAGAQVSGAFALTPSDPSVELAEMVKADFSPMPVAFLPKLLTSYPYNWNSIIPNILGEDARHLLSPANKGSNLLSPIKFDHAKKQVTLLMPGFDKSEIKLFQHQGRNNVLVEAGDQRRVVELPLEVQGKVGGAKFRDGRLIITMK